MLGKANATPGFIDELFRAGHETADRWLRRNRDHVGRFSTCDWNESGRVDVGAEVVDPMLKGTPEDGRSRPSDDKITMR